MLDQMILEDIHHLALTFIYSVVGVLVFSVALWLIVKLAPFSVQKEIEEDQNTSLGIIIGSIVIGLSIIIAASIT